MSFTNKFEYVQPTEFNVRINAQLKLFSNARDINSYDESGPLSNTLC